MGFSSVLTALLIVLVFLVAGLSIIASGQLFLAVREIALNTRKEEDPTKSSYSVLLTVAKLNNVLGWLVILGGLILAIFVTKGGGAWLWLPLLGDMVRKKN